MNRLKYIRYNGTVLVPSPRIYITGLRISVIVVAVTRERERRVSILQNEDNDVVVAGVCRAVVAMEQSRVVCSSWSSQATTTTQQQQQL